MARYSGFFKDPRQTARWKRLQAVVRATYPRCEVQGCNQLSEHVHHIVSVREPILGSKLAFEWDNLRAVCTGCHPAADRNEVAWKPRPDKPPPGRGVIA